MSLLLPWANYLYYQWKRNNWLLYLPRFLQSYEKVQIDRPIFLIGNQGGGLTLVARMLRRHRLVISITGSHKYWTGADEMQKVMMCRLPVSLRLGGRYICRDFPHEKYTPPRSWSYASDDLISRYRETAASYDRKAAERLRFIIREALYRHGKGEPGKRFLDKSQVFGVKMSYVDALLKDVNPHFVLVVRNPYAACYRAALGKAGDMKRYAKYMSLDERVDVCAQHWANVMRCVLEDREKVSHLKSVRFEDILQRPREMLIELCAFLGLSFVEEMVPSEHDVVPFGSRYPERWYPLRPDINEAYLAKVSTEHVRVIAERCGHLATHFGYSMPEVA
jgi:hypothetical protein